MNMSDSENNSNDGDFNIKILKENVDTNTSKKKNKKNKSSFKKKKHSKEDSDNSSVASDKEIDSDSDIRVKKEVRRQAFFGKTTKFRKFLEQPHNVELVKRVWTDIIYPSYNVMSTSITDPAGRAHLNNVIIPRMSNKLSKALENAKEKKEMRRIMKMSKTSMQTPYGFIPPSKNNSIYGIRQMNHSFPSNTVQNNTVYTAMAPTFASQQKINHRNSTYSNQPHSDGFRQYTPAPLHNYSGPYSQERKSRPQRGAGYSEQNESKNVLKLWPDLHSKNPQDRLNIYEQFDKRMSDTRKIKRTEKLEDKYTSQRYEKKTEKMDGRRTEKLEEKITEKQDSRKSVSVEIKHVDNFEKKYSAEHSNGVFNEINDDNNASEKPINAFSLKHDKPVKTNKVYVL